jgi:hypothetical protein
VDAADGSADRGTQARDDSLGSKWNLTALLKAHTASKLAMTLARTANGRLNMDFRIPAFISGVSR